MTSVFCLHVKTQHSPPSQEPCLTKLGTATSCRSPIFLLTTAPPALHETSELICTPTSIRSRVPLQIVCPSTDIGCSHDANRTPSLPRTLPVNLFWLNSLGQLLISGLKHLTRVLRVFLWRSRTTNQESPAIYVRATSGSLRQGARSLVVVVRTFFARGADRCAESTTHGASHSLTVRLSPPVRIIYGGLAPCALVAAAHIIQSRE